MNDFSKIIKKVLNFSCQDKKSMITYLVLFGGIGEVVNTLDCGSSMQGFDSLISPHNGLLNELFDRVIRFFATFFVNGLPKFCCI